jgi:hypothetical protein
MDESTLSLTPRSHFLMRTCVVIITSDEDVIIDNVCFAPGCLNGRACPLTKFPGAQSHSCSPSGWVLPPCTYLILLFRFKISSCCTLRLFLTRPILEPCLTFLTTIAIMSTYHGNLRASVGRGPGRISTACICIMYPLVVR